MPRIGPGREPSDHVELSKESPDDLIGLGLRAQALELCHDACERDFDVANRPFGIELTLRIEAALTLHELFAVEI